MNSPEIKRMIKEILEKVTGDEHGLLENFAEYVSQVEATITKVLHLFADNRVPLAVGLAACESILQSFEKDREGILKRAVEAVDAAAKEGERTIN